MECVVLDMDAPAQAFFSGMPLWTQWHAVLNVLVDHKQKSLFTITIVPHDYLSIYSSIKQRKTM